MAILKIKVGMHIILSTEALSGSIHGTTVLCLGPGFCILLKFDTIRWTLPDTPNSKWMRNIIIEKAARH